MQGGYRPLYRAFNDVRINRILQQDTAGMSTAGTEQVGVEAGILGNRGGDTSATSKDSGRTAGDGSDFTLIGGAGGDSTTAQAGRGGDMTFAGGAGGGCVDDAFQMAGYAGRGGVVHVIGGDGGSSWGTSGARTTAVKEDGGSVFVVPGSGSGGIRDGTIFLAGPIVHLLTHGPQKPHYDWQTASLLNFPHADATTDIETFPRPGFYVFQTSAGAGITWTWSLANERAGIPENQTRLRHPTVPAGDIHCYQVMIRNQSAVGIPVTIVAGTGVTMAWNGVVTGLQHARVLITLTGLWNAITATVYLMSYADYHT